MNRQNAKKGRTQHDKTGIDRRDARVGGAEAAGVRGTAPGIGRFREDGARGAFDAMRTLSKRRGVYRARRGRGRTAGIVFAAVGAFACRRGRFAGQVRTGGRRGKNGIGGLSS